VRGSHLWLLACLLVAAVPAAAALPDVDIDPQGEIGLVDWGLYTGRDAGVVVSDTTVEGLWHRVENVRLVERATEICAGQETMFGIRYRLTDQAAEDHWDLEVRTDHPLLHAPSGRSGMGGTHITSLSRGGNGYSGWTVRYPYEFVAGDYTFTMLHEGRVVLRKTFHVAFDCVPLIS
jgi:hypothetical protein